VALSAESGQSVPISELAVGLRGAAVDAQKNSARNPAQETRQQRRTRNSLEPIEGRQTIRAGASIASIAKRTRVHGHKLTELGFFVKVFIRADFSLHRGAF
jgi:hypothetical protein